jgi:PAS domain S-box-containing protein
MPQFYEKILHSSDYSKEPLIFLLQHAAHGFAIYNGTTIEIDRKLASILGYSNESLNGGYFPKNDLFHPADLEELENLCSSEAGSQHKLNLRLNTTDGRYLLVEFNTYINLNQTSGEKLLFMAVSDVNNSKYRELMLKKMNQRLGYIMGNTGDLIFILDMDLVYLDCYGDSENMILSPSDFIGRKITDFPFEDPAYTIMLDTLDLCKKTTDRVYEEYYLHFKGKKMWFSLTCKRIENPESGENEIVAVVRNITALKEKEESLHQLLKEKSESDARWQFALEGAGDGIWDYNLKKNEIFLSRKWKELIGCEEDEVENSLEEWFVRVHPDDKEKCLKDLNDYITGKTDVYRSEHRMRRKDGSYIWALDRGKIIEWDKKGNPVRFIGTKSDITERKNAELELLQNKETIDSLIRNLPGVAYRCLLDEDYTILFINKDIERISGYPHESFQKNNKTFASIVHPEDRDKLFIEIKNSIEKQQKFELEYRLIHKNGNEIWVKERGGGIYDSKGELKYIDGLIFDITDRKNTELSLQRTKDMLEQVSRLAVVGSWDLDVVKGELNWSDVVKEIHEVDKDYKPVLHSALQFYKEGESKDAITKAVNDAIEYGIPYELELQVITAKGREIWVKAKGVPEMENGKCYRLFGSFQDIHEIKTKEIKLKGYELLQKLTDNIPGIVYQFEMSEKGDFYVSFMSKGLEKLVDSIKVDNLADIEVSNIFSRVYKDDYDYFMESILDSAEKLTDWNVEYRINNKNEVRWHRGTAKPERKEDGTTVWFGYIHDITEERIMKLALEEKVEELSNKNNELEQYIAQNKELERFAYVVSHDLREPLRSIKAFSEIMKKKYLPQLDDEAVTYFNFIVQSASRMNDLIEGILSYTKIEKNEERFAQTDVNHLLYLVMNDLNVIINERKALIEFSKLPEIYCDPVQMRQLFQNLISNAIKFTSPDTYPVISVSHRTLRNKIEFAVKDNGIGIPAEFHEKVFGMFKQLNSRQKFEGQGIGLALCKRIIERHSGEIWIESNGINGTTIYFTIPRKKF